MNYKHKNRFFKKVFGTVAMILVLTLLTVGMTQCGEEMELPSFDEIEGYTASEEKTDYVRMNITWTDKKGNLKGGSIIVQLRPDIAPITVANFQKLVSEKFYNGLTFHRVYPGFMIQGGCPKGDGTGNAGSYITGEFAANGIQNNLLHDRGVISMARGSNSYDSASCQFFIMHESNAGLNGQYAAFGYVVHGLENVDAITQIELSYNSMGELASPVEDVIIHSATFVTKTN